MLDFSESAFNRSLKGKWTGFQGPPCFGVVFFFSSRAPSSVAMVKSSFLKYFFLGGQISDSPVCFFTGVLITSYFFSFFHLPLAAVFKEQ